MEFHWFDAFIFGFTLLFGLRGMFNGLVREIFGLLGIIGGIFLASKYSSIVANLIQKFFSLDSDSLASFFGFLTLLIVIWLSCLFLGSMFSKMIKLSGLGFLDRLGGFCFGAAKIFLIFAVLIFCVSKISFLKNNLMKIVIPSFSFEILEKTGTFIMNQPQAQGALDDATELYKNGQNTYLGGNNVD